MAYVMGGDPDLEGSRETIEAVVRGGADVVEVGIPFSDPIADGRSIQAAGVRALRSGTRPRDVLRLVRDARSSSDVPMVLMTYFNPVFSMGPGRFLDEARRSGADGVIIPDLPLEEARGFASGAGKRGVDAILMAAPTSSEERVREIAGITKGFLYLVSVLGVTGARREFKESSAGLVRRAAAATHGKVPLAVGFGISSPEQVAEVIEAGADAAVVGSAIVDRAMGGRGGPKAVESFVRSLKSAASGARQGRATE